MNPFLAGQEFDACVGGGWYHVIVQRSELTVGWMDPLRLTVDMVLVPIDEAPQPFVAKETKSLQPVTLEITEGESDAT